MLVGADGEPHRCSRNENPELFRLAAGGYGLFGVVYSVTLRLVPRRTLERVVELRTADELDASVRRADRRRLSLRRLPVRHRCDLARFPRATAFSPATARSTDRPLPDDQRVLSPDDWRSLLQLAHTDKSLAFAVYARHYLATSGQLYLSDRHQLGPVRRRLSRDDVGAKAAR